MTPSDDFEQVVEQYHRALREFVKGDFEPARALFSQRDDATLANPFGPVARGWKQITETMARAASHYRDGEATGFEQVGKYATPDVTYIVEIERYRAKIGASEALDSVALRVTSIFRREDGVWKIVHRHADPIISVQPAESVIQQ
jgi:ketosteroid isomerase-like protein